MDESNLPNVDVNVDLTEITKEAYNDTLKKPLESGSGILTTTLDFVHNTILYPMQKYNLYAKSKLNNFQKELEQKTSTIPFENLVEPKINILGPTVEGLKYNLDEEYIKDMFTNILLADMDNRKQNNVLPSYIEIVKQLSAEDAKFLKFSKTNQLKNEPIIQLQINTKDGGYYAPSNDLFLIVNKEYQLIPSIVLDNLSRLKIIDIDFMVWRKNESIYTEAFQKIKGETMLHIIPGEEEYLNFSKGLLTITDFGKNFIDICLS